VATATVVVLGIVWIPLMKMIADVLYEYLQNVQSLIAPGIAAVFIMGVFSRRTTAAAGMTSLVTGFVLGMFRLLLMIFQGYLNPDGLLYWIVSVNWLHYSVFLFLLCLVLIVVVSRFTRQPTAAQLEGVTYGSATPEQIEETRASWNKWDVIHSGIILGVVVAFYAYFW
jgi:SSS family solute:Na+ symporter